MLTDIISINDGEDLKVQQTEAPRAGNILSVAIGSLEFEPDFGIDLKYFLESDFAIQNSVFKSYCVQRLIDYRINVVNVIEVIETLSSNIVFGIGSSAETSGGLIV